MISRILKPLLRASLMYPCATLDESHRFQTTCRYTQVMPASRISVSYWKLNTCPPSAKPVVTGAPSPDGCGVEVGGGGWVGGCAGGRAPGSGINNIRPGKIRFGSTILLRWANAVTVVPKRR